MSLELGRRRSTRRRSFRRQSQSVNARAADGISQPPHSIGSARDANGGAGRASKPTTARIASGTARGTTRLSRAESQRRRLTSIACSCRRLAAIVARQTLRSSTSTTSQRSNATFARWCAAVRPWRPSMRRSPTARWSVRTATVGVRLRARPGDDWTSVKRGASEVARASSTRFTPIVHFLPQGASTAAHSTSARSSSTTCVTRQPTSFASPTQRSASGDSATKSTSASYGV